MRGNWQQKVIDKVPGHQYLNPKDNSFDLGWKLNEFGTWDMAHVRMSDLVFGYMERTNPGGTGMACEMGYGFGLGKTVILCLEKDNETQKDRYLEFMKKVAHITFDDFIMSIDYLSTFNK